MGTAPIRFTADDSSQTLPNVRFTPDEEKPAPGVDLSLRSIGRGALRGIANTLKAPFSIAEEFIRPPENAMESLLPAPALGLKRTLIDPQIELARKGTEAGKQGHTTEEMGYNLASLLPVVGPMAASLGERAGTGDVGGAIGEGAMYALLPEAAKLGKAGIGAATDSTLLRERAPSRMMNNLLKTPELGFEFGKNPGLEVANQGIVAATKQGLLDKIVERKNTIGKQIGDTLSQASQGVRARGINLADAISHPISEAIQRAREMGRSVTSLESLRDGLLQELVPKYSDRGVATPEQAWEVKKRIGDDTKFGEDSYEEQNLNAVKAQIYSRIRQQIDNQTAYSNPELPQLNESYGNLLTAQKALEKVIRKGESAPVGTGTVKALARATGPRTVASSILSRGVPDVAPGFPITDMRRLLPEVRRAGPVPDESSVRGFEAPFGVIPGESRYGSMGELLPEETKRLMATGETRPAASYIGQQGRPEAVRPPAYQRGPQKLLPAPEQPGIARRTVQETPTFGPGAETLPASRAAIPGASTAEAVRMRLLNSLDNNTLDSLREMAGSNSPIAPMIDRVQEMRKAGQENPAKPASTAPRKFFKTGADKAILKRLGYSDADMDAMSPQEAGEIVFRKIPKQ